MRALTLALLLIVAAPVADARNAPSLPRIPAPTFPAIEYTLPQRESLNRKPPPEGVSDFSSDITIAKDGGVAVKETIAVRSIGIEIRHGIVRTFPTRYRDRDGNFVHVAFHVRSVQRDGKPEPYTVQSLYGQSYVQIGDATLTLPKGPHSYTIQYDTDRAVGFFPQLDEFYWNVTGNAWTFPIEHAEAIVHLPDGGRMLGHSEYTGPLGAKGHDASARDQNGSVRFFTTKPLSYSEGLTIALEFNKGVVMPPSSQQQFLFLLRDNAMTAAALVGLAALGIYFFAAWFAFGRDPKRGLIVPLFAPPLNLSAASVRFIHRMEYDRKCFAAALVSMAVKGYLKIKNEAGTFVLSLTGAASQVLAAPERALARPLFSRGQTVELDSKNYEAVSGAITSLQNALKREDEGLYFNQNRNWYRGGLAILLVSIAASLWYAESGTSQVFVFGWVFTWAGILVAMLRLFCGTWKTILIVIGPRLVLLMGALLWGTFAFYKTSEIVAQLETDVPWIALTALLAQACLAVAFYHLLRAPTPMGSQIRDQIDGFRMFLNTAEKDRLEKLHPPAVTPEVFEKFLPYAIALDAENQWSKTFEAEASRAGLDTTQVYPRWYTGAALSNLGFGVLSDIGSSIASASVAASSVPTGGGAAGYYGGGGGGFSGGGGGGGGGSGW